MSQTTKAMKYRVLQNNEILLETDDKREAKEIWRMLHQAAPDKFHEIWERDEATGSYNGICQFAPGDKVNW